MRQLKTGRENGVSNQRAIVHQLKNSFLLVIQLQKNLITIQNKVSHSYSSQVSHFSQTEFGYFHFGLFLAFVEFRSLEVLTSHSDLFNQRI